MPAMRHLRFFVFVLGVVSSRLKSTVLGVDVPKIAVTVDQAPAFVWEVLSTRKRSIVPSVVVMGTVVPAIRHLHCNTVVDTDFYSYD